MPEETLLAFDFGERKIGVALGNTLLRDARPLEIIDTPVRARRFARIDALLAEWHPQHLIVGLPLTLDGKDQQATHRARRFANQLRGRTHLPVTLVDERGSSLEAQERTGNAPDDAMAAAIILQRYFDTLA